MVQKNNRWNITKEKGEEFAHRYIIEILKEQPKNTLSLSDLIIYLNHRTKHINLVNYKKKKSLSVYLRCVYGNIINFFDEFTFYGIIENGRNTKIILLENQLNVSSLDPKLLNEHKEWILIDDDFIFV
jgi:hypothetical protein